MSNTAKFWGSTILAALLFALIARTLFPYSLLSFDSPEDRYRIWLLTLWTSGVMAICFGLTGLLTSIVPPGFRDVNDAGSVAAALEARREQRRQMGNSAFYNFAGWTVTTGILLILIYFAAWALS
jgi:hypothetical protein